MQTTLTLYYIKQKALSKSSAIVIGPAGEKQVLYAGIMTDDFRQLGRGGLGAVLGSKKVKAIVVEDCARTVPVADNREFQKCLSEIYTILREKPGISDTFSRYGSGESLLARSELGFLPTKNWKQSTFEIMKFSLD